MLVTRLRFEPSGQPHIPGGMGAWQGMLGRKTHSKIEARNGRSVPERWKTPDDFVEGMFALTREDSEDSPLRVFLTLSEIDRRRSRAALDSPTQSVCWRRFSTLRGPVCYLSEFHALNNDLWPAFLAIAEAIDRIPDNGVRADALGIYQATVGLWEILARQGEIPERLNPSWQRIIYPFAASRPPFNFSTPPEVRWASFCGPRRAKRSAHRTKLLPCLLVPGRPRQRKASR